jgi:glycosyltransferase involved in cell wall biosynthesis
MRILQINKFFYPRGGAERYLLDLMQLLEERGHEVAPFSMRHRRNAAHTYDPYFVSHVDYSDEAGVLGAAATAARTIYNREARRKLTALIDVFRPDVAHLHNIHHQLTGSVIDALLEAGVPIVQTLHDYQWVCPVYTFVSHGEVCEACRGRRFHQAVVKRCQGGSIVRSAVAALELAVGAGKKWTRRIDRFLAPSRFLAEKVVEHGLPAASVRQQDYALCLERYRRARAAGGHALYAGRLASEKGVETLFDALARVPGLSLRVAGTGPLEPSLRRRAEAELPGRVSFLGYLEADALHAQVSEAAFVVVPSEWYENQPFAVLEAFALGTPVVGAAIGGIPELVVPDRTGLLFPSGSAPDLAEALRGMAARPDRGALGAAARTLVEERFEPGRHVDALLAVYREVAR